MPNSITAPYGLETNNPQPEIKRYYNLAKTPYTSTAQVLSEVLPALRYPGQTFNVNKVEYWFKDDIADTNLVLKTDTKTVTPQMFGAKADGITNDTTAIQNAIDFCQTNNEILEIFGTFACNTITISNNLQLKTNCNLQILTDVDGLIITGRDNGYTQANVTTVKHIGSLTIRGFLGNSFSKGVTLENGCLYSNFDKVFISNFGLGVSYKNTGNNNIINWNLLDVRDCSGAGSTTFTKGAFVSPNDIFNIGEITTPIPILTNIGTVLILQSTEASNYRTYPIVAKPGATNTYYIGNFNQLPSSGTLVYYTGGGVHHEKHQDNGAVEYKTLRLGGIAGASLTVQSFYGVTVNGGQIEGCYTNVIVGGIFMNGVNPETIYTIRCLFQGLHTEVNDANNPLIYSLKKSMITFEGCIIPQPFVASPETGVKFYDPSGSDRNSNIYYGKPTTTFPNIEPVDSTFKIYNDVENYTSLLILDLRDLLSGMTYAGDSRIKHTSIGEYNLLNIPVGETRTLRVRPLGWNTLNSGTVSEDIIITGIANVKEYKIVFLLSDKDFTYYTTFLQSDNTKLTKGNFIGTAETLNNKIDSKLPNVDNTSDANKPISTATQTALNTKEPTVTAGTTAQYYRGDKTWQDLADIQITIGDEFYYDLNGVLRPNISTYKQVELNNTSPIPIITLDFEPTFIQSVNVNGVILTQNQYIYTAPDQLDLSDYVPAITPMTIEIIYDHFIIIPNLL